MNTRILFAAPALALVMAASPAMARDSETARVAEKLRDPANQRAMAGAIAAASEAMLDMPLEPLARMADAIGDRRAARDLRRSTLGDYAGPRARDEAREMSRKLPAMMGAAGGMAQSIEEMTPALKAMAREMGARMKDAMRDGARGEGSDYDRDRRDEASAPDGRDDGPPPSAREEPIDGAYATPAPDQDPNR